MMKIILKVVISSFSTFIYIAFLLLLFIIMLAIMGMQLFQTLDSSNEYFYTNNFESFLNASITVFNVITLDGWGNVLILLNTSKDIGQVITSAYIITVIFIGNYVLLNLVLAVLLDGFTDDILQLEYGDLSNEKNNFTKDDKSIKKTVHTEKMYQSLFLKHDKKNKNKKKNRKNSIQNTIFGKIESAKKIFSNENFFKIANHHLFENFILLIIIFSSIKLAIDTYFFLNENKQAFYKNLSSHFDLFFLIIYLIEMIVKMKGFGIFIGSKTYFKDNWNRLDFFIVITSSIDFLVTDLDIPAIPVIKNF